MTPALTALLQSAERFARTLRIERGPSSSTMVLQLMEALRSESERADRAEADAEAECKHKWRLSAECDALNVRAENAEAEILAQRAAYHRTAEVCAEADRRNLARVVALEAELRVVMQSHNELRQAIFSTNNGPWTAPWITCLAAVVYGSMPPGPESIFATTSEAEAAVTPGRRILPIIALPADSFHSLTERRDVLLGESAALITAAERVVNGAKLTDSGWLLDSNAVQALDDALEPIRSARKALTAPAAPSKGRTDAGEGGETT